MPAPTIRRIPTVDPATFAFEIEGEVSAEEMETLAKQMNAAFDTYDQVNMLLVFAPYGGSELGAGLDWESIRSRFRSLSHVNKYAVVGAPEGAAMMIEAVGRMIPVEARTFDLPDIDAAWDFVGTRPA
ncbi:STAS/SEC14 domain-containing protein [Jannaschia sp. M317]|uniref:STAS/SEC14 domain-containing protein n=1 Tax=Jannaschia sp. M317 TaxID=2867011 RepID=UPI0021A26B5D|nr:STAS/SEC14 domain-containing protein [Jannaschia sp. M317]UWQ18834.1 STAS/SEC14 domain-containing protein [Jannaschia sp. M317]